MDYENEEEYNEAMNAQAEEEVRAQAEMDASAYAEEESEQNNIEKRVDEITDDLYNLYGSGTGVLFGIPSSLKSSVRAIVKVVYQAKIKK